MYVFYYIKRLLEMKEILFGQLRKLLVSKLYVSNSLANSQNYISCLGHPDFHPAAGVDPRTGIENRTHYGMSENMIVWVVEFFCENVGNELKTIILTGRIITI